MAKQRNIIYLLLCLIFPLSFYNCDSQVSENKGKSKLFNNYSKDILIKYDTLLLNVNGNLRKTVIFQDKFYGVFEYPGFGQNKSLVIFNKNGAFVDSISVPEKIQNQIYFNLIVDEDKLYIQDSEPNNYNFILRESHKEFALIKKRKFKAYEDSIYTVYTSCFGEWGGTIYFKHKKTNNVYEAASTCSIVINKFKNEYYITNYLVHLVEVSSVLVVSDPLELHLTKEVKFGKVGSSFNKGVTTLLDTTGIQIITSFQMNDKYLHIYKDNKKTYIGEIISGILNPLIGFTFSFDAELNQQLPTGDQILNCFFYENNNYGILHLKDNELHFYVLL